MRPLHGARITRSATAASFVALLGIAFCLAPVPRLAAQDASPPAPARPTTSPTEPKTDQKPDAREALRKALDAHGWTALPPGIAAVRFSGPTAAAKVGAPPGPLWFSTDVESLDSRPRADEAREKAFRASIEAAHAGRTNLVEGGEVVLVDPAGAIWAVAAHTPHLLRCFDGKRWTYRRADGRPAADVEPDQFARLAAEEKLPKEEFAAGSRRDLNDLGRWYPVACADRARNFHFIAGCVADDAVTGGGGVHTRRPDGTWAYFRILPPTMPRFDMRLEALSCVVHRDGNGDGDDGNDAAPANDPAAPGPAGGDLVTIAKFGLSDPILESHGLKVEPIPPSPDRLRHQQWKDRSDGPRIGPVYFLRFDGRTWRFDRSSVGWGVYDAVYAAWPQPDGRVYLANRFGLWEQWPADAGRRAEALIADLFEADEAKRTAAAETLASMGRRAVGAIRGAIDAASTDRSRERLRAVLDAAEGVARGDEDAVPVIGGRWRFFMPYPQADSPDGRFVFHAHRAIDVRAKREVADCLVYFDPATASFDVRPIERAEWAAAGYGGPHPNELLVRTSGPNVLDHDGGLWISGGYRVGRDGRLERIVPAGLSVRLPTMADPDGRVYLPLNGVNRSSMMIFRRPPQVAGGGGAPAQARPAADEERQFDGVRGIFSQRDLAPPWNAWAIRSQPGKPDVLLRLDGPEPTRVDLPPEGKDLQAVVPLDGGCIAARRGAAMFWDGRTWDVAPDVRTLVERHGERLAKMTPARAFAADTSADDGGAGFRYQLMLAADGQGGLWLTEDTSGAANAPPVVPADDTLERQGRRLWHWDGHRFTDLWRLIPLKGRFPSDGAVLVGQGGRALIVQVLADMQLTPGGYWAIWHVTEEEAGKPDVIPQGAREPGLHPRLLAALGPQTIFSNGLWADRQGAVWSPTFSRDGTQWMRRLGNRGGFTGVPGFGGARISFQQGRDGGIWFAVHGGRGNAAVWADVSGPLREEDRSQSLKAWAVTEVPGAGAASGLAVAPDCETYLLHEGGCSHLRLRKLPDGEKPKLPTRIVRVPQAPPGFPGRDPRGAGGELDNRGGRPPRMADPAERLHPHRVR